MKKEKKEAIKKAILEPKKVVKKEAKVKKVTKPVVKPKKVIVDNAGVIEVLEAKKGYKLCKMSDGTTKAVEDFRFN